MASGRSGGTRGVTLGSALVVAGYLAATLHATPAPADRVDLHVRVVLTLGYGHLLASWARGGRGGRRRRGLGPLLLIAGYAGYATLCRIWPGPIVALLAISAWHTVENDRAIRRASLDDERAIAPLSGRAADHAREAAWAAGLAAGVVALPRLCPAFDPGDVVAAFSLHHVVSWLALTLARARIRRRLAACLAELVRLHAPLALLCLAAMAVLDAGVAWPGVLHEAASLLLAPSTYLFWSAAHAVHTTARRRPPERRPR